MSTNKDTTATPDELHRQLAYLNLPFMRENVEELARRAAQAQWSHVDFLARLVEGEAALHQDRARQRHVQQARFPVLKTLDSFDFTAQPSINEALVRELMSGQYIDRKENVLLVGNSGTGKTHLATALAFAACAQGRRARFFTVSGLVTAMLEAREERQLERMLRALRHYDLVALDELGYVPFSKAGAELLFEVVSRAYERQSLIVTTNLPFENWPEVCGSERLTGAMLDRLTHRVHILEANGESYRLRQSRRQLKRQRKTEPASSGQSLADE